LNRLIRVFVERTGRFATPAAAARIYTTAHDQSDEYETTDEDVWPITLNSAFNVLFLLARRQWGVRLLRGGEESLGCGAGRVCAVEAGLDKIGVCTGGVEYREKLHVRIATVIGSIIDVIPIIEERINAAH
jgi:hypothetical protein